MLLHMLQLRFNSWSYRNICDNRAFWELQVSTKLLNFCKAAKLLWCYPTFVTIEFPWSCQVFVTIELPRSCEAFVIIELPRSCRASMIIEILRSYRVSATVELYQSYFDLWAFMELLWLLSFCSYGASIESLWLLSSQFPFVPPYFGVVGSEQHEAKRIQDLYK